MGIWGIKRNHRRVDSRERLRGMAEKAEPEEDGGKQKEQGKEGEARGDRERNCCNEKGIWEWLTETNCEMSGAYTNCAFWSIPKRARFHVPEVRRINYAARGQGSNGTASLPGDESCKRKVALRGRLKFSFFFALFFLHWMNLAWGRESAPRTPIRMPECRFRPGPASRTQRRALLNYTRIFFVPTEIYTVSKTWGSCLDVCYFPSESQLYNPGSKNIANLFFYQCTHVLPTGAWCITKLHLLSTIYK